MKRRICRWIAAATLASLTGSGSATAQVVDDKSPPLFSADVLVETTIVDQQGVVVETRPKTQYRMSIRSVNGVRETEVVFPTARLFPRGPLTDPRGGYRLVFDTEQHLRVYDPSGKLVGGTEDGAGTPDLPGTPVAAGIVFADTDRGTRKNDLVRRFGRATGKFGKRDRYVTEDGGVTTETLVDPESNLPVEINTVKDGALNQRTSIAYGRMPRGRWYLATERNETAIPGTTSRRFVSQRTHLNVTATEVR